MDQLIQSSSNTQNKPSIFELFAQEELTDLLQPAIKYVLSILATRYPRYLIRIVNKHEELYAILMLIIESHYLHTQSASFTESFYGLKRRNRPRYELLESDPYLEPHHRKFEKLSKSQIYGSLVFLVGVPYLRTKCQELYDIYGGNASEDLFRNDDQSDNNQSNVKKVFKIIYPYANLAFESTLLVYNLRYMFNSSPFYRPWLQLLNIDIRRQTLSDLQQQSSTFKFKNGGLLRNIPRLLLSSLKTALPVTLFILKFLQWWYSSSSPRRHREELKKQTEPKVPPPPLLKMHEDSIVDKNNIKFGIDPLSGKPLENPTLIPTGYVYSYKSIWNYVNQYHKCPITHKAVTLTQLRKVLI